MSTSFWLYNPNILFKSNEISKIWPTNDMNFEEKLNVISRLVIILTLIGFLFTKNIKILLSGLVTLGTIILLFFLKRGKKSIKEGLTSNDLYDMLKPNYTEPTVKNPVMNIMLPEINENPNDNFFYILTDIVDFEVNNNIHEWSKVLLKID